MVALLCRIDTVISERGPHFLAIALLSRILLGNEGTVVDLQRKCPSLNIDYVNCVTCLSVFELRRMAV